MAHMTCPNCSRQVRMPDYVLYATVLCPGCKKSYAAQCRDYDEALRIVSGPGFTPPKSQTNPEPPPTPTPPKQLPAPVAPVRTPQPPPPTAPQEPSRPVPRLVSPHICSQCNGTITTPTALRRTTINCPLCTKRTSLYSTLFHCWKCQALLEAPTRCDGQTVMCPNCERDLQVPREVIFLPKGINNDQRPNWFAFYCPICERELIAEKENVGQYGVCPNCQIVLEVPNWGHEAKPEPPPPPASADPLASLKDSAPIRCPNCYERIPAQSQVCRHCGAQVDSEALHRDREE